jgi:predicted XRE-type DNA-binding protein
MGKVVQSFKSVWDALADTPEEAANLRARSGLMRQITDLIEGNEWTQAEAAAKCGVTQPRMNDLLRGRVSRFSLDALVNIGAALGRHVRVELQDKAAPTRAKRGSHRHVKAGWARSPGDLDYLQSVKKWSLRLLRTWSSKGVILHWTWGFETGLAITQLMISSLRGLLRFGVRTGESLPITSA